MSKMELFHIVMDGAHTEMCGNKALHDALIEQVNELWPEGMKFEKLWAAGSYKIELYSTTITVWGEQNNCQALIAGEHHCQYGTGFTRVDITYKAPEPSERVNQIAEAIDQIRSSFKVSGNIY